METKQRADLLKDENIMPQQFYEHVDNKGLSIKSWEIEPSGICSNRSRSFPMSRSQLSSGCS